MVFPHRVNCRSKLPDEFGLDGPDRFLRETDCGETTPPKGIHNLSGIQCDLPHLSTWMFADLSCPYNETHPRCN